MKISSQFSLCLLIRSFSTTQSSNPQFIPCPKKGTMAWAASPIKAILLSNVQGEHLTVTSDEVGFAKKSSNKVGINGTAVENSSSKNFFTSSRVFNLAKDFSPSKGKNK